MRRLRCIKICSPDKEREPSVPSSQLPTEFLLSACGYKMMSTAFALAETKPGTPTSLPKKAFATPLRVQAFSHGNQDEVLAFLAERPIHTVFMSGLIRDNGLISFANRGTFYG